MSQLPIKIHCSSENRNSRVPAVVKLELETHKNHRDRRASPDKGLVKLGESHSLPAVFAETRRIEPALEVGFSLPGHSESSMENHAVSRFRPLTIMCWRKIPSNLKPKRNAARREGALRALHFPLVAALSQVLEDMARHEIMASVARAVCCSRGVKRMLPTSITRWIGSIRM